MSADLLVSEKTQAQTKLWLSSPSHALLILGNTGAGKYALASYLAAKLLNLSSMKELDNFPYFYRLRREDGKQDISIDAARQLRDELKLKTIGKESIRRVAIIEDADALSIEAQNALLKTLEEPPADTVLILTARTAGNLLPTITSRAQKIDVLPSSLSDAAKYFNQSEDDIRSNWLLSQGNAGLLNALMADSNDHPLKVAVACFKELLASDRYQRLVILDKLEKDKESLRLLLVAGIRIVSALHYESLKNDRSNEKTLIASRKVLIELSEKLQAGVSPRLLILELALNLNI